MKPMMIGLGAIALAAIAGGAVAQGRGHGGGGGGGGGHGDGGGHGNAMRAQAPGGGGGYRGHAAGAMAAAVRGHGNAMRAAAAHEHGHRALGAGAMRAPAHVKAVAPRGTKESRARPQGGRAEVRAGPHGKGPPPGKGPAVARAANVAKGKPGMRVLNDGRRYYTQRSARPAFDFAAGRRGLIDGCPPGLARKNNGCRPPGLARQLTWQPAWWGLAGIGAGSYYYNNGYLVRLNGDAIAGYLPLLGGALSVGNPWPVGYPSAPVPDYYVNYYDLGPADSYRYADDVLYRVDPSTSAITSIAGLLTGSPFQIGSPMPPGYDVYNIPYAYRDQYADGPGAWYRYSDGYIYQVDPTSRLVNAAIELIAS